MTQDDSVPARSQIAEEPADSIADPQQLRRRLNVDARSTAKHQDELENKPFAHPATNAMIQDMKNLIAMANFPANSPPQGVQFACSQEIVKFCYPEAAKAITVYKTITTPDDVRMALLSVNMCLARSSELLSQPCMGALVQTLQLPPMPTPTMNAVDWNPPTKPSQQYPEPTKERGHHHNHRFRHEDSDDDDDDGHHGGVHPLVWAFVLPFFFFGLFVATKKGLRHFRKWHEQRQLTQGGSGQVQSEDYAPLKTQEPS